MAKVNLVMPKMGESIMEATIIKWLKKPGDPIQLDESILEIATDKVDSEIPSPAAGMMGEILFNEDDVVEVGKVIAYIETESADVAVKPSPAVEEIKMNGQPNSTGAQAPKKDKEVELKPEPVIVSKASAAAVKISNRFYSPLVKNIAKREGISPEELEAIQGSGSKGRVTKKDILNYVENRGSEQRIVQETKLAQEKTQPVNIHKAAASVVPSGGEEIIVMDRMRKLIANHMVESKRTSAHVTSFVEVDVTGMVEWRNKMKGRFQQKYGQKITFTPIFIEAVVKAIRDFPMINISVEKHNIIVKKDINIGMATALPSGNLIVPVIKNADQLNLFGLTTRVNDLADRARTNKLLPDDIQGGTFTLTNVGTFGNVMGTPIINQPQVAIMATGAIRKKPAVLETDYGDVIAIRQMMFLSLSYDHRVVDGFLGGSFLRRVGDYLEQFDTSQTI